MAPCNRLKAFESFPGQLGIVAFATMPIFLASRSGQLEQTAQTIVVATYSLKLA
jgi:hypothetical protein